MVINKSICEFELDCESLDIMGWDWVANHFTFIHLYYLY